VGQPVQQEPATRSGRREIVVRPLPLPLTGLSGYSGAAVLDDASIVLVLDPANLPLG